MTGRRERVRRIVVRALLALPIAIVATVGVPHVPVHVVPVHLVSPQLGAGRSVWCTTLQRGDEWWLIQRGRSWSFEHASASSHTSKSAADDVAAQVIPALGARYQQPSEFVIPGWANGVRSHLDGHTYQKVSVTDMGVGWPFIAFCGTWVVGVQSNDVPVRREFGLLKWGTRSVPAIPAAPYWPGLVGNVVFYGVIAYALLWMSRGVRRWRRARRGLCLECAYDRNGLAENRACPECGEMGMEATPPG